MISEGIVYDTQDQFIYIYFYHNEAVHQSTVLYDNYNTTV